MPATSPHFLPSSSHSQNHSFGITPSGIRLTLINLNSTDWPSDLSLDLGKGNWMEWRRRLKFLALANGLASWLDGSLPCPDATLAPDANFIWLRNDGTLQAFIQTHVSPSDGHLIENEATSHRMLVTLKNRIDFTYDSPLCDTLSDLCSYYQRISAGGQLKQDDIFSVLILNGLSKHFGPLQQSLNSLSQTPNFNSEMLANHILDEDALIRRRVEAGQSPNPYAISSAPGSSSAFAAIQSQPKIPHVVCTNCKRETHGTDYCIAPGGKMAGRTIEEARTAFRAAQKRDVSRIPKPSTANVATSPSPTTTTSSGTVYVNGLPYVLDLMWTPPSPSAHIAEVSAESDDFLHCTCVALSEPLSVFSASSAFSISNPSPLPCNTSSRLDPSELPFIIDTGATCHISPFLSDFTTFKSIPPHPIKGLGSTSLNAVGMGTIDICTTSSSTLSLANALYVPDASVRLISVFLLGNCNTHFYPKQGLCLICDKENNVILHGDALPDRRQFRLLL